MSDDRKDLPPTSSPAFLDRVREALQTYLGKQGDVLDRGVTVRDLKNIDVVQVRQGFISTGTGAPFIGIGGAVEPSSETDLTPPPTPTGFAASAAIQNLIVTCDTPTYTVGHGHDRSILYGAQGMASQTVTMTIASPCVVTFATPVVTNQKVRLSTTGALPTGLNNSTDYFAVSVSGLTARLSLTAGGAAINTSGSQSGVHTASYTPVFSDAVELTQFRGSVAAHPSNQATRWHLWLKWKTLDGVLSVSPAGGTNGLVATTGQDVRLLLDALTVAARTPSAQYVPYAIRADLFYVASATGPTNTPLFSVVGSPITVNGVTVPVGVYMADAFIMNGTITTAKIGDAQVDTAKIVDASIVTAKIADANITTAKIADANITNAKIANLAVDAAKIANATITTGKIANAQITTALIADANITNAKIGTAAVDTLQIAGNAVVVPVAVELGSSVGITTVNSTASAGSMQTILTLSIDSAGQPILITATCTTVSFGTDGVSAGKTGNVIAAIWIDGTLIKYGYMKSQGGASAADADARLVLTTYVASPGAGSHTVDLRMQVWDTSIGAGVTYFAPAAGALSVNSGNTLVAMGMKR